MQKHLRLIAPLLGVMTSIAFAETAPPSVTPYRPTGSNPAALSAPGWLEIESGWINTQASDGVSRGSFPVMMKLAFTENFGALFGSEAYVDQFDPADIHRNGTGDSYFLLKNKFSQSESGSSAFAVEYGFSVPTASEGLNNGSGTRDYLVNGIYSADVSGYSVDLNLNLTTLGMTLTGESWQQWGWAAAVSRPINDAWGVSAELSGYSRQGTDPSDQFLVAVNYASSPRVVWDTGFVAGLNNAAPQWGVFAGISVLVGKVF